MQERLQKMLASAGVASRRAAEVMITDGRVTVNGSVVTELGTKVDPEADQVAVDGKPVRISDERVCIMLYKPAGYVTTARDPQGRPVVTELIKGRNERLFPVGRLDYNTEGLLLLTNDGALANNLAHPRYGVEKEYQVRVRGIPTSEQLRQLADGVLLDDGQTAPATVRLVRQSVHNSWISVAIHEGRFRQIRRMCAQVGLMVVRLRRVRYDFLELGELRPGEYRQLTSDEMRRLKSPSSGRTKSLKSNAGKESSSDARQITAKTPAKRRGKGGAIKSNNQ
jgi:23S rRNA pseudouridine2605 synthase